MNERQISTIRIKPGNVSYLGVGKYDAYFFRTGGSRPSHAVHVNKVERSALPEAVGLD